MYRLFTALNSLTVDLNRKSTYNKQAMKTASFDGNLISYSVYGSGKPALVFVHGWCCNSTFWEYQVPFFEKYYTVVTLDLAGHGESGKKRDGWTMNAFGRDVVAVVEELDLIDVILIGHSMGGRVVLEAAAMLSERVIGVVGVDCFQRIDEPKPPQEVIEQNLASLRTALRSRIMEFSWAVATEKSSPEQVEHIIEILSSADPEMAAESTRGLINHDSIGAFGKLTIPVRCISAQYGPEDFEATERATFDFKADYMPGYSHFVMMEDPDTFNDILDGYVREFRSLSSD